MRRRNRRIPAVLAIVMAVLMMFASCGSSGSDAGAMRDKTAKALYSTDRSRRRRLDGDRSVEERRRN